MEREPYTKLKSTQSRSTAETFTGGAFGLRVVLGIDSLGAGPTYDLNVAGDHNFIADGVVVHHSGLVGEVYEQASTDTQAPPDGALHRALQLSFPGVRQAFPQGGTSSPI
jgi:hypothetical protein